jgi:monofunctional biosynthetic peptidoglycan transglycosylase
VVGGSTISQQLAKNLFLSPSRSYVRKGQEAIITFMMEAVMDKRRILEIYLNVVEWGDGVFGAEAAAQHYYRIPAQLGRTRPGSGRAAGRHAAGRTELILGRMNNAVVP